MLPKKSLYPHRTLSSVAIIGLLATISVVALNNARAKARDTKRVADIKQIQTALEMYFNDAGSYPNSLTPGESISNNSTTFMADVPAPATTLMELVLFD